jgi:hypothetical protein
MSAQGGRGWAYTGAILGGVVSVAANVAHSYVGAADPEPLAVALSIFWPVAVFVAVEITARVDWARVGRWAVVRWIGVPLVGLMAAVVSYRHLSGLLTFYGEDAVTAAIGPLAVDGLMLMATAALIATGRGHADQPVDQADLPTVTSSVTEVDQRPEVDQPAGGILTSDQAPDQPVDQDRDQRGGPVDQPDQALVSGDQAVIEPDIAADVSADIQPDTSADTTPDIPRTRERTTARTSGRTSKPDTGAAVARLAARHPDWSSSQIARRLGVTDRTVRRHLSTGQSAPLHVVGGDR